MFAYPYFLPMGGLRNFQTARLVSLNSSYKGEGDTVIERNGRPVAALIPFEDYEALLDELDDLRAGRRAQAALEAWEKDRSLGTPLEQVEAEWRAEGLLD